MEVAMANEKEIEKIEKELSSIFAQMIKNRSEIRLCEKDFEETLNTIKDKYLAENEKLTEIAQKYQKLIPESQQLLRQYFSSLSNRISLHKFEKKEDFEGFWKMWKRYSEEINDFFNGK